VEYAKNRKSELKGSFFLIFGLFLGFLIRFWRLKIE